MKKCDEIQEKLIDEFYDKDIEPNALEHIESCRECMEFRNKLSAISQKLDILDVENLSIPSNLYNVINKAENIKEVKRKRFESLIFIGVSFSILIPYLVLGFHFEIKILLYLQLIAYFTMPLALIPLIINKKVKEV